MQKNTTRRRLLQGLAVGAIGSLAGCTAGSLGDQSSTSTDGSSENDATGTKSGSYSVTMEPVGTVTFEEVPQKWLVSNGSWADMGVALGRDSPTAITQLEYYRTDQYYEEIPGVSVDKSEIIDLADGSGVSPEVFYKLDADVHVMDPNGMNHSFKGLERQDIERIKKNVAPFFGNSIYREIPWHDYRYYTLYEAFGKIAQVFQQQERYKAFARLHKELQQKIDEHLPTGQRPTVAIVWAVGNEPEKFLPYLIGQGTSCKQWRDLEVRDALAMAGITGTYAGGGSLDYESLLAIDPDVLLIRGRTDLSAKQFQNTIVEFMINHPIASELRAVKNRNVFRAGTYFQGPIFNFVLTERAANQLYPDAFDGVKLYDPQRVADIVHGRF